MASIHDWRYEVNRVFVFKDMGAIWHIKTVEIKIIHTLYMSC